MKRYGARRSPCFKPQCKENSLVGLPFTRMEALAESSISAISWWSAQERVRVLAVELVYTLLRELRPTPSIDTSNNNTSDLQSSNYSVSELKESSGCIMSKPMIKFVKAADCPKVIKINNSETARKSTVKYAEMYINISKELMELCTGLQRQQTHMAVKIKAQDLEISILKARVKFLEDKDRGSAEPSQDSMEAMNILTSRVAAVSVSTITGVSTIGVPTVSGLFPTVSAIFTTASVVTPYSRRPRGISAKDKGKEKVVESEVNHPIIDWEIHSKGQREYWKIIRLGGHTAVYQFFVDMLKQLDIENLHQLWALVKENLSIRQATKDKEKELWVELKRLFEPDFEDQL
nr:hypothetical protein [Tanacetum cinerariifolium]